MATADESLDVDEIRQRITSAWDLSGGFDVLYGDAETVVASDIYNLLDEVERLRAVNAAQREYFARVLDDAEVFGWQSKWITKARALLAQEEGSNGD